MSTNTGGGEEKVGGIEMAIAYGMYIERLNRKENQARPTSRRKNALSASKTKKEMVRQGAVKLQLMTYAEQQMIYEYATSSKKWVEIWHKYNVAVMAFSCSVDPNCLSWYSFVSIRLVIV